MNILKSICWCFFPNDNDLSTAQYSKLSQNNNNNNNVSLELADRWDGDEFDDFDDNWDHMESQKKDTPDIDDGRSRSIVSDDSRSEIVRNNKSPSMPEMRKEVTPVAQQTEADLFANFGMSATYKEQARIKKHENKKAAIENDEDDEVGSALYNLDSVLNVEPENNAGWGDDVELDLGIATTNENEVQSVFDLPNNNKIEVKRSIVKGGGKKKKKPREKKEKKDKPESFVIQSLE